MAGPSRVVIVPDKFKGTLSARRVAEAMAQGVRRAAPEARVELQPMADGGDGTIDALVAARGGHIGRFSVSGPLGDPVESPIAFLEGGACAIEMALASGLVLLPRARRDAMRATSVGTGQLVRIALERSQEGAEILVGIGGSASTDGGVGAASAVGWRFLDDLGRELPPGGSSLLRLRRIDGDAAFPGCGRSVVGVSDVDNPLLGERGAARVFAPQKGASPEQVEVLEEGLERLADAIVRDVGLDVRDLRGAGACGGIGAGLVAFFGARLEPGFQTLAEVAGLGSRIEGADLVVTGEGLLDEQSLAGKAPVGVAAISKDRGVPCVAVAGEVTVDPERLRSHGIVAAASLIDRVGEERALGDPAGSIAAVTEAVLRELFAR